MLQTDSIMFLIESLDSKLERLYTDDLFVACSMSEEDAETLISAQVTKGIARRKDLAVSALLR